MDALRGVCAVHRPGREGVVQLVILVEAVMRETVVKIIIKKRILG